MGPCPCCGERAIPSNPTFDEPGDYGALRKSRGPAVPAAVLADVDVVLVSHADHADNLDRAGRSFALGAPRLLTCPDSARALGGGAKGLRTWESVEVAEGLTVTAVPAQHGPADGERDAHGHVNCEVTGFVIRASRGHGQGDDATSSRATRIYLTGDNASLELIAQVRDRFGRPDHAVINAGRAAVPGKLEGRPLSLSGERASAAASVLGAPHVVLAHQTGWDHFTDGPCASLRAFRDVGPLGVLERAPEGEWSTGPMPGPFGG